MYNTLLHPAPPVLHRSIKHNPASASESHDSQQAQLVYKEQDPGGELLAHTTSGDESERWEGGARGEPGSSRCCVHAKGEYEYVERTSLTTVEKCSGSGLHG